ncbi:MAG: hypothetical protein Q9210_002646, partial [Variospora velana]
MHPFSLSISTAHLLSLLLIYLLTLATAAPANTTLLHTRQEPDSDDTLARTMCFCTNNNRFTQLSQDPPAFAPDFVSHAVHKIGIVYKIEYYNKRYTFPHRDPPLFSTPTNPPNKNDRIDHHFALHALDTCTTDGFAPNPCLNVPAQDARWVHTFYTTTVPPDVTTHAWTFSYHFKGGGARKRDYFTFYKSRRDLPRRRAWMADQGEVRARCTEVCRANWGMEFFEDGYGRELSRIELFRDFDDICYLAGEQQKRRCVRW